MSNLVVSVLTSCLRLPQDGGTNAAGNCSAETLRRTSQHSQAARDLPRSGTAERCGWRHVTAAMRRSVLRGGGFRPAGASWGGGQPYYILDVGQRRLMRKLLVGPTVFCPHNRVCCVQHTHTHTLCKTFRFVSLNGKHPRFQSRYPSEANEVRTLSSDRKLSVGYWEGVVVCAQVH